MASGGSSTKTTQKAEQASTVTLPAWMTEAGQRTYADAEATAKANPIKGYGRPMTAGVDPNQRAASTAAAAGMSTGAADLDASRAMTARSVGGAAPVVTAGKFGAPEAAEYMSPYTGAVQERTMAEMGRQNEMQRADLGDGAQGARAFGGTRQAVLEGEQARGQNANMLDYLARSNAEAYSSAQGQFERDRGARMGAETTNGQFSEAGRDRELAAAGMSGEIARTATGTQTDNIMNLLRTGGVEQDAANAGLGADYNEFLRMQDAPMERSRDLMAMLAGAPRNVVSTGTSSGSGTSKTPGSLMNTLMGAGMMGASAFAGGAKPSDRRLKRGIQFIERLANGLGIYRYNYWWDLPGTAKRIGVMADEVARIAPRALGPRILGFMTVNYAVLRECI